MPNFRKTHDKNLQNLCILCLRRSDQLVSPSQRNFIKENVLLDISDRAHVLPSGICSGCRKRVDSQTTLNPRELPPRLDYEQIVDDLLKLRVSTRTSPDCCCDLCLIAQDKQMHKSTHPANNKYLTGVPTAGVECPALRREKDDSQVQSAVASRPLSIKVCTFCMAEIGKGKPHSCDSRTSTDNAQC